jgi:hypothetical protein
MDHDALGEQQVPFGVKIVSEAAEFSACRNHAVAGNRRIGARAHDVSNRTVGPRPSSRGCHITVRRDASARDPSDDRSYTRAEIH